MTFLYIALALSFFFMAICFACHKVVDSLRIAMRELTEDEIERFLYKCLSGFRKASARIMEDIKNTEVKNKRMQNWQHYSEN